jgi:hypothetical protein
VDDSLGSAPERMSELTVGRQATRCKLVKALIDADNHYQCRPAEVAPAIRPRDGVGWEPIDKSVRTESATYVSGMN